MHNIAAIAAASTVIDRADLLAGIDLVQEVTETRNTIPILSNVRILGEGGRHVFLTTTDIDIEMTVRVPAAADPHLATTLPVKALRKYLKNAPASDCITIDAEEHKLIHHPNPEAEPSHAAAKGVIDFGKVRYTVETLPASDFPEMPAPATNAGFSLPGDAFWAYLDRVKGAISTEETRYYLNGIYLHADVDGALRMVATDGHRLYLQEIGQVDGAEGIPGVIVPRKTVAILHKLMKGKKCPASVSVAVSESKIRFSFTTPTGYAVTITSKVIDGTFPDYQRVIPANNDRTLRFDAEAMAEAVAAVSQVSSSKGRAVKLELSETGMHLVVNDPDEGRADADIACSFESDGGLMEVGYNAGYIIEMLATLGDGEVTMKLSDPGNPAIATGAQASGFKAVIMPMRI